MDDGEKLYFVFFRDNYCCPLSTIRFPWIGDSNNDNFVGKLFGECSALLRHGAIFEIISTTLRADNMFHIMIREYFVDYEKSESSKINESI